MKQKRLTYPILLLSQEFYLNIKILNKIVCRGCRLIHKTQASYLGLTTPKIEHFEITKDQELNFHIMIPYNRT
jgi:hypothetical protein